MLTDSGEHIFALHIPNFWKSTALKNDKIQEIDDRDIMHHLVKVLRVQLHDQFIFFDREYHGLVQVAQISKKNIAVRIVNVETNLVSKQKVTFLLPLLKKEALEQAVYSLSEIGVSCIQLVITQKSRQKLLHDKEFDRLQSIIIAAAQQSKNYCYPHLLQPKILQEVIDVLPSFNIVFDAAGKSFFELHASASQAKDINLLIGPEAGLTQSELSLAAQKSFQACRLTATTLRAVQAVVVGCALFKLT